MRNVELTPEESRLLRAVQTATAPGIHFFPHGNNLVVIDDEDNVPEVVQVVSVFKVLGWDEDLVKGLAAKLMKPAPKTVLTWHQPKPHNPDDGNREYVSECGRFTIEVGWYVGDRGGDGTSYVAHDSQEVDGDDDSFNTHRMSWCHRLSSAVAWCESRAQGKFVHPRHVGRVHVKGKTRFTRE